VERGELERHGLVLGYGALAEPGLERAVDLLARL
jgi:hypothetical protein